MISIDVAGALIEHGAAISSVHLTVAIKINFLCCCEDLMKKCDAKEMAKFDEFGRTPLLCALQSLKMTVNAKRFLNHAELQTAIKLLQGIICKIDWETHIQSGVLLSNGIEELENILNGIAEQSNMGEDMKNDLEYIFTTIKACERSQVQMLEFKKNQLC